MPGKQIRIALIDDERLVAEAIKAWLARCPDYSLVGQAGDAEQGRAICLATRPDLALMDLKLPGRDGLELAEELLAELPNMRILAMSGMTDPHTVWKVWQSGIHGFIDKTQSLAQLQEAIQAVMTRGTFFSKVFQEVKENWLSQPEAFQKVLSDREQEVLKSVVLGWNDERIAKKMNISANTVAFHRKSIRKKLGLHNDREMIAYGRLWGFC